MYLQKVKVPENTYLIIA